MAGRTACRAPLLLCAAEVPGRVKPPPPIRGAAVVRSFLPSREAHGPAGPTTWPAWGMRQLGFSALVWAVRKRKENEPCSTRENVACSGGTKNCGFGVPATCLAYKMLDHTSHRRSRVRTVRNSCAVVHMASHKTDKKIAEETFCCNSIS